MSDSTILAVAVLVFVMMVIGLGLTVWEFRCGQPRREDEQARPRGGTREPRGLADAARDPAG